MLTETEYYKSVCSEIGEELAEYGDNFADVKWRLPSFTYWGDAVACLGDSATYKVNRSFCKAVCKKHEREW